MYSLSKAVDEEDQPPSQSKKMMKWSATAVPKGAIEVTHHPPPNETPLSAGKQTGYNPTRLSNPDEEPYLRGLGFIIDRVESIWINPKRWQQRRYR